MALAAPTQWRDDQITPRHSPFPKGRPPPAKGQWRSVVATGDGHRFMVFAQVQEGRENFKACLAIEREGVWQVLVRLEHHGSHPGLHVHDWCGTDELPRGGRSFEAPSRRPATRSRHRRVLVLNRASFWSLALGRFGVRPLGADQGELL